MSCRRALAGVALSLAVPLAMHLYDVGERQHLLKNFVADRSQGTVRIAERYGLAPDQCVSEQRDEFYALAAALLTVESLATSHLQSLARGGLAKAAAATGIAVDFSIGPGRIKPSTARMLMNDRAGQGADATRDGVLIRRLLEPCGSLQVAILLLQDVRSRHGGETDLTFVRSAAAVYNGQSPWGTSLKADIAAQLYFDLVYNIFQHYRFLRHA